MALRDHLTDPHAERSVIGSLLLAPQGAAEMLEVLHPEAFSIGEHRAVWEAIGALVTRGTVPDLTTITGELRRLGKEGPRDWWAVLTDCAGAVPSTANRYHYVQVVNDRARRRRVLEFLAKAPQLVLEAEQIEDVLEEVERQVLALRRAGGSSAWVSAEEVAIAAGNDLVERSNRGGKSVGRSTGLGALNSALGGGLEPEHLVIVAGRPSMGKTSLAMQIAEVFAAFAGPVGVFSLEARALPLMQRMAGGLSGIPALQIRQGWVKEERLAHALDAYRELAQLPIFFADNPCLRIDELKTSVRWLHSRHPLSLLVVDYLQLIEGDKGRRSNREQEVAAFSRGLKNLAMELKIPVIALSQLNRELERRPIPERRPRMADLRESGAIEQDADVILFVYRPEVYEPDKPDIQGDAEIIISKQRNGPTGFVRCKWSGERMRFYEEKRSRP